MNCALYLKTKFRHIECRLYQHLAPYKTIQSFTNLQTKPFRNVLRKGYNAISRKILLYQTTKILALSKFNAFANDKFTVNQKLKFLFEHLKNIVGKGEDADDQHFLLFPQCFHSEKASFPDSQKCLDCIIKGFFHFIHI